MKLCWLPIALIALNTKVWESRSSAFTIQAPSKLTASSRLSSMILKESKDDEGDKFFEIFPVETYKEMHRMEGMKTVKTYQMPAWSERVQYRLTSNGRPVKGEVTLWLGPERKTHTLTFDNESGTEFPIQVLLKFKKGPPVLRMSTAENANFPLNVAVYVPTPERAKELEKNTEKVWNAASEDQKQLIQGSNVDGKLGMRVNWVIPANVDSIQLLGWSRDTGKKSFRVQIELIQGPNNVKQKYTLQCGGGSQPFHAVFQTPGPGWTVRIQNKKFVEDGLLQMAVIPYETSPVEKDKLDW